MRSHHGAIALAFSLALSAVPALAQSSPGGSQNSVARGSGGEVFFYGPLSGQARSQTLSRGALENTGIGRPNPRGQHQVTPVPEPSQWALMLAGLALVGYMVRRNARPDRDAS